ncbi:MAG TPA: rod shape-determining protein MreC [Mollicutes bacterium]|nr:rod shape-determining protein MreC [Mollicutes bacterium]
MKLNRRRKKMEGKYLVLIIVLVVFILIGFISLSVKDDRGQTFIEKGLKDIGLNIQNILYTPFRFVGNKIDNYNDMKRIYKEYKALDESKSKTNLLEEENKELKKSVEDLKKLLDLKNSMSDYELVNATVINRNVGSWYNTLTIDKGAKNDVKVGMVVLTGSGLIGKVIKTNFYTSDVKLITTMDLNNKISVGILTDNNMTYGLLSGYDLKRKELLVIDIIDDTIIKEGDTVVTSGLSDAYPKGIVVGVVSKVENDDFGTSRRIRVKPATDFNYLNYVTILKGEISYD